MPAWEREAEELAKRPDMRFTLRFQNRQRVLSGLPEVAAYFGTEGLEPPDELVEPSTYEEPAPPETHKYLGQIAEFHLGSSSLVELRHPKYALQTQVHRQEGPLTIAMLDDQEFLQAGEFWRRRVKVVQDTDGAFRHQDIVAHVETDPEYATPTRTEPGEITRIEMVSFLTLLLESRVYRQEE